MRANRRCVAVFATALAVGAVSVQGATAQASSLAVDAGLTSKNVEFVTNLPVPGGATSAKVVGKRLYVTGWATLAIFDIEDPANPVKLSQVPLGFEFPHEDVDTNGKVLVLAETTIVGLPRPTGEPPPTDRFHVWDVRDPRNPREIATLPSNGDRSLTCVYNCTYAYGAAGTILDLADPVNPRVVGNWGTGKPANRGFDVTVTQPGVVLTATRPMMLLDGRDDVLNPKLVAVGEDTTRTTHATQWPHSGNSDVMLSTVETFGKLQCDSTSGPLITWDASGVTSWDPDGTSVKTIPIIDQFRLTNGTGTDGRPVTNKLACSAHAFDAHPSFRDGGLVALGHFDHGTRFVKVDTAGRMSEVGWFMPFSGQVFQARWGGANVVYSVDLERGVDVLRWLGGDG